MGPRRDPWFIEASPFDPMNYGAYPDLRIRPSAAAAASPDQELPCAELGLPEGVSPDRLPRRLSLLESVDHRHAAIEVVTRSEPFDRFRQAAVALLSDAKLKRAFDVVDAEPKVLDRYGRNTFGWSLLMAAGWLRRA